MKRIKVFQSVYNLQKSIDEWIEKENPDIISVSCSVGGDNAYHKMEIVAVVYDDRKNEVKI